MNHGALFNGIGGFQLAASWLGWKNVFSVEIDKWCNKVTKQHFPDCIQHTDICKFDGRQYNGSIDIVSGGFPCQPFSVAGKQRGKEDDRYLWPEMLRVISEINPTWVVGENVSGIIGVVLDEVLSDLENIGYEAQTFVIPACATNAPHRRDRVWIVAYSSSNRCQRRTSDRKGRCLLSNGERINTQGDTSWGGWNGGTSENDSGAANAMFIGLQGAAESRIDISYREPQQKWASTDWLQVATNLCRMDDGLPRRVDRNKRLKALGNAIVPQVAYQIFRTIDTVSQWTRTE